MDTTQHTIEVFAARCLILIFIGLGIAGCETTQVISTSDHSANNVVTRGIDVSDIKQSATKLVDDINAKGLFTQYQGRQPVIGVSTVINNTAERIDPAMLTDVIMSSLSDKARVMINRGMGADGRPRYEDYMGAAKYQEDRFREDSQQAPRPDLMLSGEVRSSYAREKRGGLLSRGLLLRLTDGETVVWQGYATTSRGHPPGRGVVTTLSSLPYNGPLSKGQNWFVQGYVLEIMSNAVVKISVGSNQGFAVGDKLDLIEKTLRSAPKGGGFVGVEKTMGELEISILAPNSSEARHAGSLAVQKGWIVRRKTMPKSGQ